MSYSSAEKYAGRKAEDKEYSALEPLLVVAALISLTVGLFVGLYVNSPVAAMERVHAFVTTVQLVFSFSWPIALITAAVTTPLYFFVRRN